MINPLFIDGPLKGQNIQMPHKIHYYNVRDLEKNSVDKDEKTFTYVVKRFVILSAETQFAIYLAYCNSEEPEAELIADSILSDAAKKARCD